MRTHLLFLLVGLVLILGACSGGDQTQATQTPEPESDVKTIDTDPPAVEATETDPPPIQASPTQDSESISAGTGSGMECTVTELLPPIDPTTQALFPPVSGDEWAIGPGDALLSIVEYSDFQ